MSFFIFSIYNFLIHVSEWTLRTGASFVQKWQLMISGRQLTWEKLTEFSKISDQPIWIHCASLGEFEQGRPVIERIREKSPTQQIIVSFFSPSGYEIIKDYQHADLVIYLPGDTLTNARKLISLVRPKTLILVKYEFWWNLLRTSIDKEIPVYVISAVFRDTNYYFRCLFRPMKNVLSRISKFYVQDKLSGDVLRKFGIENFTICGDTRVDRVITRSKIENSPAQLISFFENKQIIIYGSAWMTDIDIIRHNIDTFQNYQHIIVPHNIDPNTLNDFENKLGTMSQRYSQAETLQGNILILDAIGILSGLYRYAKYVYIGGGYGHGIHNILEPSVYKIPVFYGPNHQKFNEAVELVQEGATFVTISQTSMANKILFLDTHPDVYKNIQTKLDLYFQNNQGATETIVYEILEVQN
jgi:3-deoxy-D-manno-octulosonic-acid transferase